MGQSVFRQILKQKSVDLRGFCKKIEAKHIAIIFLIEKKSSALTGLLKVAAIFMNLQSDLIFLDAGLNPQTRKSKRLSLDDVPAGGAVDMFYRYGFFSLSVRVVPRDDPGRWLIREPTADIFDKRSIVITETAGPNTFARQPFQISLCGDLDELLSAFFRDFKADGVEQPHKLFTGSWRLPTAAQYLGLSPQALDDSVNSYVLVKLVRNKGTKAASGN